MARKDLAERKDVAPYKRARAYSKAATSSEALFYGSLIEQLVDRRKAKGQSAEQLAHQIGVSDSLVAKWEVGIRVPSAFYLMCWCQALEVSLWLDASLQPPALAELAA